MEATPNYGGEIGALGSVDLNADDPGPIDPSILYDQEDHVSSAIWEGLERGVLRCHEHTSKIEEWKLTPKQVELVEKAGFKYFRKIGSFVLDKQLISALVERWRRETNTFHFPVGEMTITLDEVVYNLGLAIDGEPVVAAEMKGVKSTTVSVCKKLLGKTPTSVDRRGGFLKLSWLKETFSECPEDASDEQVEQYTRGYLLYLVGSTIFSTTSGNTVPVMYLPLFQDFDEAGKYAWGAATLAFLYRALGNATDKYQSTISGCLTLLQSWSYFHLNIGRPKLDPSKAVKDVFPLAIRWKQKPNDQRTKYTVIQYRKALDSLQLSDVEWMPYKDMEEIIPENMKASLALGKSRTTLFCFHKAEEHLPDRCMRQFGLSQPIPQDVPQQKRNDSEGDSSKNEDSGCEEWLSRWDNIVKDDASVGENEYMQWYSLITRKFIGRHASSESLFRETVVGLTKMLDLVETLQRDDMAPKNAKVVQNIKSTLIECLKNPIAFSEDSQPGKSNKKLKLLKHG